MSLIKKALRLPFDTILDSWKFIKHVRITSTSGDSARLEIKSASAVGPWEIFQSDALKFLFIQLSSAENDDGVIFINNETVGKIISLVLAGNFVLDSGNQIQLGSLDDPEGTIEHRSAGNDLLMILLKGADFVIEDDVTTGSITIDTSVVNPVSDTVTISVSSVFGLRFLNDLIFQNKNGIRNRAVDEFQFANTIGNVRIVIDVDSTNPGIKAEFDDLQIQRNKAFDVIFFKNLSTNQEIIVHGRNAANSNTTTLTINVGQVSTDNDIDYTAKSGDGGNHIFHVDAGKTVKTGSLTSFFRCTPLVSDPDGSLTADEGSMAYFPLAGPIFTFVIQTDSPNGTNWQKILMT